MLLSLKTPFLGDFNALLPALLRISLFLLPAFHLHSAALPAQPRTCSLCLTIFLIASLPGPRYLRGSNSAGFSANTCLILAVNAIRRSVSILTLQIAIFAALL